MNPQRTSAKKTVDALPLQGKTVLITRPKDRAEEFSRLLQDRGATVVFVPTIQIVAPASWEQCDAAIDAVDTYDGLIFTSVNGVRGFFGRLDERKTATVRSELRRKTCYAVGEKTEEALVSEEMHVMRFADATNAQELADALLAAPGRGKKLLFPKGNLASEEMPKTLKSACVTVDEVVVYETIAPREEDAARLRKLLSEDSIDIITFFSASSVKHLAAIVPKELLFSRIIAVIGGSTATAVKQCGFSVSVAAVEPTAVDLANAIVEYCTNHRKNP